MDQWFIAKINQHGMMLIVGPAAENMESPVLWPRWPVCVPARQLFVEYLLG